VPALEYVDGYMGERLAEAGYTCLITDLAYCGHRAHTGRKCRTGEARTLVIGCEGSIWARRGIRFSWNGSDCDVRGNVPAALPFDDGVFRELYCDTTEEIGSPAPFLAEAWRVLRPNGRLDLMKSAARHLADALDEAHWDIRERRGERVVAACRKKD
jgi:hypothetical protein